MRATGRRLACAACAWAALAAAEGEAVKELLLDLSAALEEGNAARFLGRVDRRAAQYATLERNVVALLAQYQVGSSVAVIEQQASGDAQELQLDWLLQLRPAGGGAGARQCRARITCKIRRSGKVWAVTSLDPVEFFSAIEKGKD